MTKADFETFLASASNEMHKEELSSEELDSVAGGIGLLAVAGVFTATYKAGTAIGKFAYNIRH